MRDETSFFIQVDILGNEPYLSDAVFGRGFYR